MAELDSLLIMPATAGPSPTFPEIPGRQGRTRTSERRRPSASSRGFRSVWAGWRSFLVDGGVGDSSAARIPGSDGIARSRTWPNSLPVQQPLLDEEGVHGLETSGVVGAVQLRPEGRSIEESVRSRFERHQRA